ncbi:MAG: Uma2 family endonuclease [Chloroflexota bacterium]|nr:Uma2 family endonuclease [Chloroflexota bacterium]
MIETKTRVTVDEFHSFIEQPENVERNFELIDGEIEEKMVSYPYGSQVAKRIGTFIDGFVIERNLGYVTTADGGYIVGKHRFIPDLAFVSYARMPELIAEKGYGKIAPDLVVEVISPTDKPRALPKKSTITARQGQS